MWEYTDQHHWDEYRGKPEARKSEQDRLRRYSYTWLSFYLLHTAQMQFMLQQHTYIHCKKCGLIYDTMKCLSHQIWSGYHFHSVIYYTNGVISTLHFLQCIGEVATQCLSIVEISYLCKGLQLWQTTLSHFFYDSSFIINNKGTCSMMWCDMGPYQWLNKFYNLAIVKLLVGSYTSLRIEACHRNHHNKT